MSRLNTLYPNDDFLKNISNAMGRVDSKNETQIKQEIEQIGYKEFYRHYNEQKVYIKQLQQENQQLKIQISAREEEYKNLKNKVNKIIETIDEELIYDKGTDITSATGDVGEKMKFYLSDCEFLNELRKQLNGLQKSQIFIDTQDMEEQYGEQLYQDYLEKQVKELKKELEDKEDFNKKLQATKDRLDKYNYKITMQQQEFINYLEDEIKKLEEAKKYPIEFYESNLLIKKFNVILQKYKEVIGVKDENNL